jgi:ABC-type taurine transport system substrate-binding protein
MAITADYGTLVGQASKTVSDYLWDAKDSIDKVFGKGYAEKHPELVAAFIKASADDFNTAVLAVAIQEASDKVESALHAIADK